MGEEREGERGPVRSFFPPYIDWKEVEKKGKERKGEKEDEERKDEAFCDALEFEVDTRAFVSNQQYHSHQ